MNINQTTEYNRPTYKSNNKNVTCSIGLEGAGVDSSSEQHNARGNTAATVTREGHSEQHRHWREGAGTNLHSLVLLYNSKHRNPKVILDL